MCHKCVKTSRTNDGVDHLAALSEESVEGLCLDEGAGEAVEDEALRLYPSSNLSEMSLSR